jgi:hypothetical protein
LKSSHVVPEPFIELTARCARAIDSGPFVLAAHQLSECPDGEQVLLVPPTIETNE